MPVSGAPACHIDLPVLNSSPGSHGCLHDSWSRYPACDFEDPHVRNRVGHNPPVVLTPCPGRELACPDAHAAVDHHSGVHRTKVRLRPRREPVPELSADDVRDELH